MSLKVPTLNTKRWRSWQPLWVLHCRPKSLPDHLMRLAFLLLLAGCCVAFAGSSTFIQSFSLADVELDANTDFAESEALNHDYLLMLDVANLLYNFRYVLPASL